MVAVAMRLLLLIYLRNLPKATVFLQLFWNFKQAACRSANIFEHGLK